MKMYQQSPYSNENLQPQNQQQEQNPFAFGGSSFPKKQTNQTYSYMNNPHYSGDERNWEHNEQAELDFKRGFFGRDYNPEQKSFWSHMINQKPGHFIGDAYDGLKGAAPVFGAGVGAIFGSPETGIKIGEFLKDILPASGLHDANKKYSKGGSVSSKGLSALLNEILDETYPERRVRFSLGGVADISALLKRDISSIY